MASIHTVDLSPFKEAVIFCLVVDGGGSPLLSLLRGLKLTNSGFIFSSTNLAGRICYNSKIA